MAVILVGGAALRATIQRRCSAGGSDESLLLAVFGVTLLVAGVAQSLEVSGAIGAFLVGLALSGPVAERAEQLISPLQDLFAATFFLFFSFQIDPADLFDAAGSRRRCSPLVTMVDQAGHRLVSPARGSVPEPVVASVPGPR